MQILEIIPLQYPRIQTKSPHSHHGGMQHLHRATRSAKDLSLQDNLYKRILKRDNVLKNIYKYIRVN